MQDQPSYKIVFKGKIKPEFEKDFVTQSMCDLFHISEEKAESMLAARSVVLKKSLNKSQAQKYINILEKIGMVADCDPPLNPVNKVELSLENFTASDEKNASVVENANTETRSTHTLQVSSLNLENETENNSNADNNNNHQDSIAKVENPLPVSEEQQATQFAYVKETETNPSIKLNELEKAFTEKVPPIKLPLQYRIGIVFTGITMAMLPLIYLGLIAFVIFCIHFHAVENITILKGGGIYFRALLYCAPIVAGSILVLFMIKPLFARSMADAKSITVDPIKEPKLFYFVNKIADCVGSPVPKQIKLNCEVNASAGFRNGFASFFSDDLVLTLGMPLVTGLTMRQLAGVLAHEFGHFAQGTGMRFHYIAWKVNGWFYDAVYHRDSWDAKLEALAKNQENWLGIILQISRGLVWLTRRVLHGFMLTGQLISSFSLRQMEFDADRYEASVAGSDQFKSTCLQLQRLMIAMQVSNENLAQTWEDGKLVDDLPSLIQRHADELPEELDSELTHKMLAYRTHMFDSHPSDKERIINALKQKSKGIFKLQNPSSELFKHYKIWAKHVTLYHYQYDLGINIERNKLVDVDEVVDTSRENKQDKIALENYFNQLTPDFKFPLSIKLIDTTKHSWQQLTEKLQKINKKLVLNQNTITLLEKFNSDKKQLNLLYAVDTLSRAGFQIDPESFGVTIEIYNNLDAEIAKLNTEISALAEQLAPIYKLQYTKLSLALTMLNHPLVIKKIENHAATLQKRHRLSNTLNEIFRRANELELFQRNDFKFASLLHFTYDEFELPEGYELVRNSLMKSLQDYNQRLMDNLHRIPYPFENNAQKSMAEYINAYLPEKENFANDWSYTSVYSTTVLEKLAITQFRAVAGLARIAVNVESILFEQSTVSSIHEDNQEKYQDENTEKSTQQIQIKNIAANG